MRGSSPKRSSETAKRRQREERQKQQKGRNAQAFARMRPEPARERSGKGGPDPRNRSDEGTQTKTTFPVRDCVPRGLGCVAQKENAGWFVIRGLGGSVRCEGANVRKMRLAQAGKVGIEQCTLPSSHRVAVRRMAARFVLGYKSVTWQRRRSTVGFTVDSYAALRFRLYKVVFSSVQFSSVYCAL